MWAVRQDDDRCGEALPDHERLELLRHRCFVRCDRDHTDLWPYNWSAIETA